MELTSKYEPVLDKYGLDEIKADYLCQIIKAQERETTIGLFGEGVALIQLLVELFELEDLKSVLFPGAFHLKFVYGEEKTYIGLNDGNEVVLSQDEFIEKLSDTGGLELPETIFEGKIVLPFSDLEKVEINAYTLGESFDDKILIQTDVCALALSATHMLSLKERALIKNSLCDHHCFFVCNIDKLQEDEKSQVLATLSPYTENGEKYYILPCREVLPEIFAEWVQISNLEISRQLALDEYYKPQISHVLEQQVEDTTRKIDIAKGLLEHLSKAKDSLPEYKSKTVRYINTHYIEGLKTNTSSEIISFYEKLNQDIVDGVKEERNVKELQEELPHFIAGEWTEYIDKNLSVQVHKQLDEISPAVEEYVNEKIAQFLEDILTHDEFECLNDLVRRAVADGKISDNQAGNISGNTPLDKRESTTLRRVLPKCLIALGGVAVLTSSFIPGALLILAGFKGNKDAVDDMQGELVEAGKKLNHEYLKEAQSNLDELMKQVNISTELTAEQCFANVLDSLIRIIQSYEDNLTKLEEKIADLNADLNAL